MRDHQTTHAQISSLITNLSSFCTIFKSYSQTVFSMTAAEFKCREKESELAKVEQAMTFIVEDINKKPGYYFGEFVHLNKPHLVENFYQLGVHLFTRSRPHLLRYLHFAFKEAGERIIELQAVLDKSKLLLSTETLALFLMDAIKERAAGCDHVNFGDGVWRPYTVAMTPPELQVVKLRVEGNGSLVDLRRTDVMMVEFRVGKPTE